MKESGYYRVKKGGGFSYQNEQGKTLSATWIRNWIESLAIPPAWRDVWISKDRHAYLLATGYDQKNRKQYIYHPDWEQIREEKKIKRMKKLGSALPRVRSKVETDLVGDGLSRTRVLAAVVRVIDETGARVGNLSYTRENHTHGVTTLRSKHIENVSEGRITYIGKGGKERHLSIADPKVRRVIRESEETPGYEVFKYIDESGRKQIVTADETNEYIKGLAGGSVTAKDFRTWLGTVTALAECVDSTDKVKSQREVFTCVAKTLGNTPAIARDSYVLPIVVDLHEKGQLSIDGVSATKWLSKEEVLLKRLLKDHE